MRSSALVRTLAAAASLALASPARGQVYTRPHLAWRTVRTTHFTVHFPAEAQAWTLDLVPRLEAIHAEVSALVGYAPGRRVTVVVEDPSAQANGAAFPFLDEPVVSLWPTPADPRSNIGSTRDPAEQLAVHELAHTPTWAGRRATRGSGCWCASRRCGWAPWPRALRAGSARATPPGWRGGSPAAGGRTARCGRRCCASGRWRASCRATSS
jgi:hypothetical protein